jgi:hypothetical protein
VKSKRHEDLLDDLKETFVEVIKQLKPPQTRKEIQKLTGMMTALS